MAEKDCATDGDMESQRRRDPEWRVREGLGGGAEGLESRCWGEGGGTAG